MDGTLADTERDGHRVAFNQAFAEAGLDWEWNVPLYGDLLAVTGGKERMRHYVERYRPDQHRPDLDQLIARLHAAKTGHYTSLVARAGIPLRPGVRRLLDEARARGVLLAIVTTTTADNVVSLLEHALPRGADGWFAVIGAGDVVAAKKPAPDIYHYVLDRLGVPPADCIAFEDSENGLRSARAAGLTTVVTITDYSRDHDLRGAALLLDHLGDPGQPCHPISDPRGALHGAGQVDLEVLGRLL